MVSREAPQWVRQSFIRSALGAGASASEEELAATYAQLVQIWCEPDRHHHDLRHLLDMLKRIDTMAPETPHADWVRLAAWFHGIVFSTSDLAVYTRNGGEDEIASAKLADQYMEKLGISDEARQAVKKMITGLKKPSALDKANEAEASCLPAETQPVTVKAEETNTIEMIDMDQLALCDAHLGALAVEPQKYRHYLEEIRAEYAHINYRHFVYGRMKIVTKLLARKKLFYSPLAAQWQEPARDNLEAELERLKAKLAELDREEAGREAQVASADDTAAPLEQKPEASFSEAELSEPKLPEVMAVQTAPGTDDSLQEHPKLPAESDVAANAMPLVGDKPLSSLEKLADIYSPGRVPRIEMTPEQAAREERKNTAEKAWEAIAAKRDK